MEKVKELLFDLFDRYDTYEEIIADFRSLASEGEVTDQEYDYCLAHWDDLLEEWEGGKD